MTNPFGDRRPSERLSGRVLTSDCMQELISYLDECWQRCKDAEPVSATPTDADARIRPRAAAIDDCIQELTNYLNDWQRRNDPEPAAAPTTDANARIAALEAELNAFKERYVGVRSLETWQQSLLRHSMDLIPIMGLDGDGRRKALIEWQLDLNLILIQFTVDLGERHARDLANRILEHPDFETSPRATVRDVWLDYQKKLRGEDTP